MLYTLFLQIDISFSLNEHTKAKKIDIIIKNLKKWSELNRKNSISSEPVLYSSEPKSTAPSQKTQLRAKEQGSKRKSTAPRQRVQFEPAPMPAPNNGARLRASSKLKSSAGSCVLDSEPYP